MAQSRNVPLIKAITAISAFAMGLWANGTLSPYLLLLTHSNTAVGLVQGLMGVATILSSVPVGVLSDKTARHYVAKLAAFLQLGAMAATVAGVVASRHQLAFFWASSILWGFVVGCQVNMDALFADSVATGRRSAEYTQLQVLQLVFMASGSLVAALLLRLEGNEWTLRALGGCIVAGMFVAVPSAILMLFLHDKYTLGDESEALNAAAAMVPEPAAEDASEAHNGTAKSRGTGDPAAGSGAAALQAATEPGPELVASGTNSKAMARTHWIPPLMLLADVTVALASGMTVKFYPIFFKNEVHMSPDANSLLAAAVPFSIAASTILAQVLGKAWGRVPAILFFRWLGVAFLLVLGLFPSLWTNLGVIIPLYLARAAAANSPSALQRSILMDYVPKNVRGRWSSLDGLTIFGWSGSAFLGGYLLDRTGFAVVFLTTAALQLLGSIYFLAMLPIIPLHETPAPAAAEHAPAPASLPAREALLTVASDPATAEDEEGGISEPLLPES